MVKLRVFKNFSGGYRQDTVKEVEGKEIQMENVRILCNSEPEPRGHMSILKVMSFLFPSSFPFIHKGSQNN